MEVEDIIVSPPISSSSASYHSPHSNTTNSTPSYNTEEEDVKPKLKRKRHGRVLGALRQEIGTEGGGLALVAASKGGRTLHVGPTATSWKMAERQLESALTHHLINMGRGVAASPTIPLVYIVTDPLTQWPEGRNQEYKEILFSLLLGLGARRTTHTAVIGGSASIGSGISRENACTTLVQRACDRIEETRVLFDEEDVIAKEIGQVLRVCLHTVTPGHPFARKLVELQVAMLLAKPPPNREEAETILTYDATIAAASCSQCFVTDEQLIRLGWTPQIVMESIGVLDNISPDAILSWILPVPAFPLAFPAPGSVREQVIAAMRTLRLYLLREATKAYAIPISSDLSLLPHDRLRPMVLIMGHITRAGVASINNNSTFYAKVTENIVAVVLTVETHLANLAALWCEGRKDEEARKFLKEAQEPFLAMLGFAVRTTSSITDDTSRMHNRAVLYYSLDVFPGWLDLAISAAAQNQRGSGPLAEAGFSLIDLKLLHLGLVQASFVFAQVGRREVQLARALAELAAPEEATNMVVDALAELELD